MYVWHGTTYPVVSIIVLTTITNLTLLEFAVRSGDVGQGRNSNGNQSDSIDFIVLKLNTNLSIVGDGSSECHVGLTRLSGA